MSNSIKICYSNSDYIHYKHNIEYTSKYEGVII